MNWINSNMQKHLNILTLRIQKHLSHPLEAVVDFVVV